MTKFNIGDAFRPLIQNIIDSFGEEPVAGFGLGWADWGKLRVCPVRTAQEIQDKLVFRKGERDSRMPVIVRIEDWQRNHELFERFDLEAIIPTATDERGGVRYYFSPRDGCVYARPHLSSVPINPTTAVIPADVVSAIREGRPLGRAESAPSPWPSIGTVLEPLIQSYLIQRPNAEYLTMAKTTDRKRIAVTTGYAPPPAERSAFLKLTVCNWKKDPDMFDTLDLSWLLLDAREEDDTVVLRQLDAPNPHGLRPLEVFYVKGAGALSDFALSLDYLRELYPETQQAEKVAKATVGRYEGNPELLIRSAEATYGEPVEAPSEEQRQQFRREMERRTKDERSLRYQHLGLPEGGQDTYIVWRDEGERLHRLYGGHWSAFEEWRLWSREGDYRPNGRCGPASEEILRGMWDSFAPTHPTEAECRDLVKTPREGPGRKITEAWKQAIDRHEEVLEAIADASHPYHDLASTLARAFDQAASGKGKERHANDLPFNEQKMQRIAQGQGHAGGLIYQVCKKAMEAERLEHDAKVRELLGVIVYAAGAIIFEERAQTRRRIKEGREQREAGKGCING